MRWLGVAALGAAAALALFAAPPEPPRTLRARLPAYPCSPTRWWPEPPRAPLLTPDNEALLAAALAASSFEPFPDLRRRRITQLAQCVALEDVRGRRLG
jgi:hypothetical protein